MPEIQARITRVYSEEGSEWTRIETDHERVKRLDTKNKEAASEAARLKNSGLLLIDYTEREGNINQHTGKPYLNRYYEKAGPIGTDGDDGIEVVKQAARKTDPTDAWRMTMAKCAELAIRTIGNLPESTRTKEIVLSFDLQQNIALAWARLIFFSSPPDPSSSFGNGLASFHSVDPSRSETPPPTDDDIPY